MNQIKLLNSIKDYLTRFQLLVKIANAENEYDINNHAENIIIPILNIIFKSDFKNANIEKKNADSIDLLDRSQSIAIQVTSTSGIEKVKSTLEKFLKYNHHDEIKNLFVYVISEKQNNYSQEAINKILKSKLKFDVKRQIIDARDIYGRIKALNDLHLFKKVNELLENQFSDSFISESFTFNDFVQFKKEYQEKCITNFSRLNFFGLSVSKRPREVELYSLFVKPIFSFKPTLENYFIQAKTNIKILNKSSKIDTETIFDPETFEKFYYNFNIKNQNVDSKGILQLDAFNRSIWDDSVDKGFDELFTLSPNLVILGNPGAGKSSMIKYSICKILQGDESIFKDLSIYDRIPFRLELHKYNQSKVIKKVGFVDFLVETLISEYQTILSKDKLIKVLTYFPSIVFFDGLDEIFDIQERIEVRNDIENFIKTFSQAKVIVTSRYESYEEVNLDDKLFQKIEIKNFNQKQLEDYVQKWYSLEEANPNVRKDEIYNCLEQLKLVDDELKYNPLLLSLILILYRNDLELPTNKLSIYEGCTNTIVETRDTREKKLGINLKISSKISVFSALAFWQFNTESKNINNNSVQAFVKDYLLKKNEFQDEYLANTAANEFLDFAKTRSIYFENKFTHKTFLEYFTAYYIFSNYYFKHSNLEKFNEILNNNLGLSSWAVVLELLICKIDSNLIDYEVIENIITEQLLVNTNDAILFFLQIMKYLTNVSDSISVILIKTAICRCFSTTFKLKESKIDHKDILFNHIVNLFRIYRFRSIIKKTFSNLIEEQGLTNKELSTFAYEFSIISKNYDLVKLLEEYNIEENDPHSYLLKNYKLISNKKTYLKALEDFIKIYSIKDTIPLYYSYFNQKIFFGYDKFNWNVGFLITTENAEQQIKSYNELRELGITQEVLKKSVAQKFLKPIDLREFEYIVKKLPNSNYKNFVKDLIKVYSQRKNKQPESPGKFYDNFFIKHNEIKKK